jgi:hypothetical protein
MAGVKKRRVNSPGCSEHFASEAQRESTSSAAAVTLGRINIGAQLVLNEFLIKAKATTAIDFNRSTT